MCTHLPADAASRTLSKLVEQVHMKQMPGMQILGLTGLQTNAPCEIRGRRTAHDGRNLLQADRLLRRGRLGPARRAPRRGTPYAPTRRPHAWASQPSRRHWASCAVLRRGRLGWRRGGQRGDRHGSGGTPGRRRAAPRLPEQVIAGGDGVGQHNGRAVGGRPMRQPHVDTEHPACIDWRL